MNNTICTRIRCASRKSTNKRNRTCKSAIGTTTIKMDETVIANTRRAQRGREGRDSQQTEKINTIFRGGPSKATAAARRSRFHRVFFLSHLIILVHCFTFFFVTTLVVVAQNNEILFWWKQKQFANRQRAKSYNLWTAAAAYSFVATIIILILRGWFIWRSPPSCARYFYYYLPLYERTRFIGPFAGVHFIFINEIFSA